MNHRRLRTVAQFSVGCDSWGMFAPFIVEGKVSSNDCAGSEEVDPLGTCNSPPLLADAGFLFNTSIVTA
jgi:hypothetical protein